MRGPATAICVAIMAWKNGQDGLRATCFICHQVSDDGKGHKLEWGQVPFEQIYGPDGWCNSDQPVIK